MHLTTFTDYSLRVLIFVAAHGEGRATIAKIARAFDISESHLRKVVHFLGRHRFLANVRGRGGGLELALPPSAISVAPVVRKAEDTMAPAECFEVATSRCAIARVCELRGVLEEAMQAFYGVLEQYTLQDLVRDRAPLARILFVPPKPLARR